MKQTTVDDPIFEIEQTVLYDLNKHLTQSKVPPP
jgi:hypothetical protein